MAVAIWAMVQGKVVFPREVETWRTLYDKAEKKIERLENMVDGLTGDLSEQNRGHLATLEFLKSFIPISSSRDTPESHPRRRHDDQ